MLLLKRVGSCLWRRTASRPVQYSLNTLHMNSFTDLLTLRSIGCKQSVQLIGTLITWMLCSSSKARMASVGL